MDGVPDVTQDPMKPGETSPTSGPSNDARPSACTTRTTTRWSRCPTGWPARSSSATSPCRPASTVTPGAGRWCSTTPATIGYSLNGKSFPATAPIVANAGDWVEIHYLNEGMQIHPMHLHGMPQLVIAKDGYPLANPQSADTVTVAPGERYTVLVHATEPGTWVWHCHILSHAEKDQGMFGMVTALVVK